MSDDGILHFNPWMDFNDGPPSENPFGCDPDPEQIAVFLDTVFSWCEGLIPLRGFVDKGQGRDGKPHNIWIPADDTAPEKLATFFCGCRSVCKEILIFWTCDRVRTFVRPVHAADMAPLAGMVMRGAGPNLQQRARGSEKVSGLPDPDHVDHLPMQIMPSSQLGGPSARSVPDQAPISTGPR